MSGYQIAWTIAGSLLAVPIMVLLVMAIYATFVGLPVECEISIPWTDKTFVIRVKPRV